MKATFHIDYLTRWGEELFLSGSSEALGAGDPRRAVRMRLEGSQTWIAEIDAPDEDFSYSYTVRHADGTERHEWGAPHRFIACGAESCRIFDHWQDLPASRPFYSSAFTDCIFHRGHRGHRSPAMPPQEGRLTIMAAAPTVMPGQCLAICGESESMGSWNPANAARMSDSMYPVWSATIDIAGLSPATEFKFVLLDEASGELICWEEGHNRRLGIAPSRDAANVIAGLRFDTMPWLWRGAGTAIPVFSLRTDDDFGVGDFYDMMPMIDWAAATGQKFLQILPVNDTTMGHSWSDSYPYNANSTFALHPQYLRLSAMGRLNDGERQRYYDDIARELNSLPQIDYERVNNTKNAFTHELFMQDCEALVNSDDFKRFVAENEAWLVPYAAFCVLRDRYQTPDFHQWDDYAIYTPEKIEALASRNTSYFRYVYYLQYHLDKQLRAVHAYAKSRGVAIKGDIPIGISSCSVEAWIHPDLFFLDSQAGAPPDDFSVLGQNWGFPTYNWEAMSQDGYAWWKARLRKMGQYFDAYRIDHVLGFFRIWEIPCAAVHGLLGHFNKALPLAPDEMAASFDFDFDPERQTTPLIMGPLIEEVFGPYAAEATLSFLEPNGDGTYRLKDEWATQKKVAEYFALGEPAEKDAILFDGLMTLIDQVLFIEDPEQRGKYHPRISAQDTYPYKMLSDYQRWCFDRLYEDFYYRRHNEFWERQAMWKLPPLTDCTGMLPCAEDLGMIPACVPAVIDRLKILSLEIQRMPKEAFARFGDTWHYPYLSVCTTSTHDMSGIRAWWEEDRQMTQEFFNHVLRQGGSAPDHAEPWICRKILDMHLKSPSMLCVIPLQDWLSMDGSIRRDNPHDERINVPANSRHYWRYRMHLTIADLMRHDAFNAELRDMIAESGR